jgi:2,2-dialkylglycine decarboxylase (pyruvate)
MPEIRESLALWERYGEYVLMATAYQDRVLTRAHGSTIVDADGNTLIDLEAGQICSILGHNHPKLIERIVAQTQEILHHGTGFLSRPVLEASAKMADIAPGELKKSIILSTGAEANECAFRIARSFTGKRGIVGFDKGYSGLTLATMAVGGNSNDASLAVPGALKILTPDCAHCPVAATYPACDYLCASVSEKILDAHNRDGIAAIVVEPILSSGGMIFPPPGYFKRLHELARKYGALLIADEAQTGMARTGTWFAMEADGVVPDILVFSKGVGGGFPASGVIVTDEIADQIMDRFGNFSSHQSEPVAAIAISTVIDVIKEEGLLARAPEAGERLMGGLRRLSEKYHVLGNIRGRGLMVGADALALPAQGLTREEAGLTFEFLCRDAGVHLKSIHGGAIFRILPALTITDQEIDATLGVFEDVMTRMVNGGAVGLRRESRNRFTRRLEEVRAGGLTMKRVIKKAWETSPAELYRRVARLVEGG